MKLLNYLMMFSKLLCDVDKRRNISFFATSLFKFFVILGFCLVIIVDVMELGFIVINIIKVVLDQGGLRGIIGFVVWESFQWNGRELHLFQGLS
jgi:hypothetical protein